MKVVSETPVHKQGDRLQMKLELRQKRLSIDPSSTGIIAESPIKYIDGNGSWFFLRFFACISLHSGTIK